MNRRVLDAAGALGIILQMLETVGLIPARGEDIEGDLAADRVAVREVSMALSPGNVESSSAPTQNSRQIQAGELLLQGRDELLPDVMLLVVRLVLVSLRHARVPPDGAHVDHAVPELDKGAPLDGDVQVRHVVQDELDQLLVLRLADPLDEAVRRQGHAALEGREPVFGKAEIEEGGDRDLGRAELLLLLGHVAAAYIADGAFLAERGKEGEHLCGGRLWVGRLVGAWRTGWRKVGSGILGAQERVCHRHQRDRWYS